MGRPAADKEQNKREGERLKAAFDRKQAATGITQSAFCASIELSHSLLHGYFSGDRPMTLEILLKLSIALDTNAVEIRPELTALLAKMLRAMRLDVMAELVGGLDEDDKSEVINFIEFIKAKKAHQPRR